MIDITNKKFGKLTATKYLGGSKWLCKCECGREKAIRAQNVKLGLTKSCGQCTHDFMIGKKFNKLSVIKIYGQIREKKALLCKCDCGNEVIVDAWELRSGIRKSCGCHKKTWTILEIGKKYGELTVIGKDKEIKKGNIWICKCSCGKLKRLEASKLTKVVGGIKSCGCQRYPANFKDLTGKKFNKLTAIKMCGYKYGKKNKSAVWLCQCECGNYTKVIGSRLTRNEIRSCGCLNKIRPTQRYKYKINIFRSAQELLFAIIMEKFKIDYEYEPKVFIFKTETKKIRYRPDFYLKKYNLWVEIKGMKTELSETKLKLFSLNNNVIMIMTKIFEPIMGKTFYYNWKKKEYAIDFVENKVDNYFIDNKIADFFSFLH